MRVAVGSIEHESSSFSPVETSLEVFESEGRYFEGEALAALSGEANTVVDGFIKGVRLHGAELVPLIATYPHTSRQPTLDIHEILKNRLLDRLRDALPVDGVLLDLHGGYSVQGLDDGDGDILQAVRELVGPDCLIMAVHDPHCNIGPLMVENADALIIEDTYPHVDMAERALEAADMMVRTIRGEIRPTMAYRPIPMFWAAAKMISAEEPIKSAYQYCFDIEMRPGVLTASIGLGYQWADIPIVGASTIVVTDNDPALAQQTADELAQWLWDRRDDWQRALVKPVDALAEGDSIGKYPIILADQADNPGGGSPSDGTEILNLFIDRGLQDAAILYIVDPEVVQQAMAAGVGATIDVQMGGKSCEICGPPVPMTVEVLAVSDGRSIYDGPMWEGVEAFYGDSVMVRQDGISVVVISGYCQPIDLAFSRSLGLDCRELKYICVKSTGHFRSGFEPIAGSIFNVDTASVTSQDFASLPFTRLGRKIYPIDTDAAFELPCGSSELPLPHACREALPGKIRLSEEHLSAVARRRKVVLNFDVMIVDPKPGQDARELAQDRLAFTDDPEIRIDSIWWNWGEGNVVPYPSKFLPRYNHPGFQYWFDHEIDIAEVFLAETHARGIECFFSMRMNGADNDPQFVPELGTIMDMTLQGESDSPGGDLARGESGKQIINAPNVYRIPLKEEHPEWLFHTQSSENGYWNYAHEGVREYYFRNLREVVERYDFDGIELDFARGLVLPPGEAWQNRHHVTDFMRQLRRFLLEVEARREKPFLLAARVPENLMGCHFDGLDVETWAEEQLVDILVMGCRSLEVDVAAFRQITAGKTIRLFPALDDHHSSDGYCTPEIEVLRGVVSNWRQQGVDGLQTFNFAYGPRGEDEPWWEMHRQFYRDISDPDRWDRLAKTFVVQRRGGGHGPSVHPNPEDWSTPRAWFANTNLLSPLPVPLDNLGKADVLFALRVGDDLQAHADRVASLELWLLLHDSNLGPYLNVLCEDQPPAVGDGQIERAVIRDWFIPERKGKSNENFLYNSPPQQGIENQVEVRVNNLLLPAPEVRAGWLIFPVAADMCALGENLVGVRVKGRDPSARPLSVEKLELRLRYREP